MTRKPASDVPRVFRIDGRRIESVADFYREVGRAVNGPGGYFGSNLDALAERLLDFQYYRESAVRPFEWKFGNSLTKILPNCSRYSGVCRSK